MSFSSLEEIHSARIRPNKIKGSLNIAKKIKYLAFLSFEKDGCQASKPSTIILYFLAMFKEPLNFIWYVFFCPYH